MQAMARQWVGMGLPADGIINDWRAVLWVR